MDEIENPFNHLNPINPGSDNFKMTMHPSKMEGFFTSPKRFQKSLISGNAILYCISLYRYCFLSIPAFHWLILCKQLIMNTERKPRLHIIIPVVYMALLITGLLLRHL